MKTESYLFTHWSSHSHYMKSVRIQSKFEKIQTRKTPNMDTFHAVSNVLFGFDFIKYISNIY